MVAHKLSQALHQWLRSPQKTLGRCVAIEYFYAVSAQPLGNERFSAADTAR